MIRYKINLWQPVITYYVIYAVVAFGLIYWLGRRTSLIVPILLLFALTFELARLYYLNVGVKEFHSARMIAGWLGSFLGAAWACYFRPS